MWRSLLLLALAVPLSAQDLTATLGALRGIHVEDEQTDVPPDAILLMSNAKDGLRNLAIATLRGQPGTPATIAPQIQNTLAEVVDVSGGDVEERFGDVIDLAVTAPAPDLLAVEYTLNIPCGSDALLLLFRFDGQWRLVYERREDGYDSISSGLGSFQWSVSPPDARGRVLVLTASISPWCVSNWHGLEYRVERIDPHRDRPIFIDEGSAPSFGWEYQLATTPGSYSLHFDTRCFDGSLVVRSTVLNYRVENDHPVRVDPIADSPRTFIEEWFGLPEASALQRTTMGSDAVAEWRGLIGPMVDQKDGYNEFGPVERCSEDVWQISINHFDHATDDEYTPYYFVVTGSDGHYQLTQVSEEEREGCEKEKTEPVEEDGE